VVVVVAGLVLVTVAEVRGLELRPREVGEFVDGELVGLLGLGVVGLNVAEPVLEDGEASNSSTEE